MGDRKNADNSTGKRSDPGSDICITPKPDDEMALVMENKTVPVDQISGSNQKGAKPLKTEFPECGKLIVAKILKRHINEIHSEDIKMFPCNLCDFTTKREVQLNKH